jgi:hypothetical protein
MGAVFVFLPLSNESSFGKVGDAGRTVKAPLTHARWAESRAHPVKSLLALSAGCTESAGDF